MVVDILLFFASILMARDTGLNTPTYWVANSLKQNNSDQGSFFGGLISVIGILCCLPSIAWLQAIIGSFFLFGFTIAMIFGLLYLLYEFIKRK